MEGKARGWNVRLSTGITWSHRAHDAQSRASRLHSVRLIVWCLREQLIMLRSLIREPRHVSPEESSEAGRHWGSFQSLTGLHGDTGVKHQYKQLVCQRGNVHMQLEISIEQSFQTGSKNKWPAMMHFCNSPRENPLWCRYSLSCPRQCELLAVLFNELSSFVWPAFTSTCITPAAHVWSLNWQMCVIQHETSDEAGSWGQRWIILLPLWDKYRDAWNETWIAVFSLPIPMRLAHSGG